MAESLCNLQPVDRSLIPSGRSAPGASIQACCGIHRCLGHQPGYHVQWARSVRGMDGSPTALAYQLPQVAGSRPCPEPPQRAPSGQGHSGPHRQHCCCCIYQPARRFTLPSHVATCPPPPPLDLEASEVPSCHPHPSQECSIGQPILCKIREDEEQVLLVAPYWHLCGSWMGRRGSRWPTPGGSAHYHFSTSTVH